ncbi:MAG: hypothetical protein Ct9H300mP20_21130 [Gammaproteobacteria bacterium]|nr:MAG: hypothetical protein Ct9H300mP20_21130 [Gammaproteobacteria bacterium]
MANLKRCQPIGDEVDNDEGRVSELLEYTPVAS